jgi:hypothetical protein
LEERVGLFQVGGEGDQLAIFLAELLPEDVCTTMYAAQYPNRTQQVRINFWIYVVFVSGHECVAGA